MTIMANMNFDKLNARIDELHDALVGSGQVGDAGNIIRDENRRLIKQVVAFTPPNQGRLSANSKKVGENAVTRDLNRAMQPIVPEDFKSEKTQNRVRKLMRQGNVTALEKIVRNTLDPAGKVNLFSPLIHRNNRDSRGRVNSNKHNYVVGLSELKEYRKRVINRVGRLIASLMPSYEASGAIVRTPWIKRHKGKVAGSFEANFFGEQPFIRTHWRGNGVRQMQRVVSEAVRARSEAIGKRIRLVRSGYARAAKAKIKLANASGRGAQFADTGGI